MGINSHLEDIQKNEKKKKNSLAIDIFQLLKWSLRH